MRFPTTAEAIAFNKEHTRRKASITPRSFEWYPYDSLGNVENIHALMGDKVDMLLEAAGDGPLLDIGTADGDMAFLMESIGLPTHCIDNPMTNYNGLQGLRAMKEHLHSEMEIFEMDLDDRFEMPDRQYPLAFCLGLIYHLKNPLYTLETLAKHARYAVFSTRVLAASEDQPAMAYLLDAGEMNNDDTNHWIFSTTGFKKALQKSKWEVLQYRSARVGTSADQRDFCFVKSVFGLGNVDLLEGWHEYVPAGWRWTAKRFSFGFKAKAARTMRIYLFLPQSILSLLGPITLKVKLNDTDAGSMVMQRVGEYIFRLPLEGHSGPGTVTIELDKATTPDSSDWRELGLIVSSIEFE